MKHSNLLLFALIILGAIGCTSGVNRQTTSKTYPASNDGKNEEWYAASIAPDFSSMSFVNKKTVVRNGDSVTYDAWKFDAKPTNIIVDSAVMSVEVNCKNLKGRINKITLLNKANIILDEESVSVEGFKPGTEPYVISEGVCLSKYLAPSPKRPDSVGVRKILESMKR